MCEIEKFFGCYMLVSRNEQCAGCTYIGFTNNPSRREGQHNKGKEAGGAWKTSGKGPWDMALIVHGFPNEISALQFEWAWQNPEKSRHLRKRSSSGSPKQTFKKANFRTPVAKRLMVMIAMVNSAPWKRLPLTIRWLCEAYKTVFDGKIPLHMPIAYGRVKVVKTPQPAEIVTHKKDTECHLCKESFGNLTDFLTCYWPDCRGHFHMTCLAENMLQSDHEVKNARLLPVLGTCPTCKGDILWGDLIRYKHGCYRSLLPAPDTEDA